jgi:zinc transporter ZupT
MLESVRESGPVVQALLATIGTYLLTVIGTVAARAGHRAGRCLRCCVRYLLAGGAFLYVADQALPHLHAEFPDEATSEGPNVEWHRSGLLMLAMTLHNFPEGRLAGAYSFGVNCLQQLSRSRA